MGALGQVEQVGQLGPFFEGDIDNGAGLLVMEVTVLGSVRTIS